MAKRTAGERIVAKWLHWADGRENTREEVAIEIDRAIRRARAEAFDEGYSIGTGRGRVPFDNPYRKVKR